MRVISGLARGRNLACPSGKNTRPTTDRIKETLFNILQKEVPDADFLDLFAGSGGIGIEALSRGCRHCVFVDSDRQAVRCIRENLKRTGFEGQSQVMAMDVMQALGRLEGHRFDIVFMDPPYRMGIEERVLPFLLDSALVGEDTLFVIEASRDKDLSYLEGCSCRVERIKEYKTNRHVFLRNCQKIT